jgi:hypothetical protein
LRMTRELFLTPKTWVYWPKAVDTLGQEIDPTNEKAYQWSLSGAFEKFAWQELWDISEPNYLICAAQDFLNDTSGGQLIRGKLDYDDEMILLDLGIEHLAKEKTDE